MSNEQSKPGAKPTKPSVLVDLTPALSGYAGIPQEARLLFKTLVTCQESQATQKTLNVDAAGLIYSPRMSALRYNMSPETYQHSLVTCADYFYTLLHGAQEDRGYRLLRFDNKIKQIKDFFLAASKRRFDTKEVSTEQFFDFIWRVFFSQTLLIEDYALLKNQRYFISNFNMQSLRLLRRLKRAVEFNTQGWDFVIFQSQRPVKVSPGTTKIVRYHDSIPLQDMDVVVPGGTGTHGSDLLYCAKDSFYVCNSEPTREQLVRIVPELEERSITIAPMIANFQKTQDQDAHDPSISATRARHTLLSIIEKSMVQSVKESLTQKEQQAIMQTLYQTPDFPYLLILSTLEPRKNHLTLIRAWERLRLRHPEQKPLRLIVVGSPGWRYQDILTAMQSHVRKGDIIHVEKILPEDMTYFYSQAESFVFPSYSEGFGYPPLEAMQCECPVVVSDIPTHRWVYGDAALYANPYDVHAFVEHLEALLYSPERAVLRQDLIAKGKKQLTRYTQANIGQAWEALLTNLKRKGGQ